MTILESSRMNSCLAAGGALLARIGRMSWRGKACLVAGGYVVAIFLGLLAVACNDFLSGLSGAPVSPGMQGFADMLLFLVVAAVGGAPSTLAWCIFLRPYPMFWRIVSTAACLVALTAPAVLVVIVADSLSPAANLGFLRILMAPFLMGGCLLAGLGAPGNGPRIALFSAAATEAASFGLWLMITLLRNFF